MSNFGMVRKDEFSLRVTVVRKIVCITYTIIIHHDQIKWFQDFVKAIADYKKNCVTPNLKFIPQIRVTLKGAYPHKQVIKKYGYPLEVHTITTEDGYILELHRIPHGRHNAQNVTGSSVLLFPGLACNSASWLTLGPEGSLAFMLADEGYDVWLANYRGTTWSLKHETLDAKADEKEYFNFSFQEIARYDLVAHIDHILAVTNQKQLFYIGHSQGTTTFFALAAEKPEYNNKVKLMVSLAPVAYTTNLRSPIFRILKSNLEEFQEIIEKFSIYELFPYNFLLTVIGQLLCNDNSALQPLCASVFYFLCGYSPNFNKTVIPEILSNIPAGSSSRMIVHYAQIGIQDTFQKYDFGESENLKIYGQSTPPSYDISKILTPIATFYADNDLLSSPTDVDRFTAQLSNSVSKKFIEGYNHLDYLWSYNVVSQELILKNGYPLEVHKIRTEDGYILETYRIPHGKNTAFNGTKIPVLFVHCLTCSAAIWVIAEPENSLAFTLADEGYDIWLANCRGNVWSLLHETLDPKEDEKEFFDFSFQEMGYYDVPANIDYILNKTDQESLFYVGHSQGTTSFFAMAADRHEYNSKIRLMSALAPVAYTNYVDFKLYEILRDNLQQFQDAFEAKGKYNVFFSNNSLGTHAELYCEEGSILQPLCAFIFYNIFGYNPNFDTTLIPQILSNIPAGTSTRCFFHYAQLGIYESFQKYDFGESGNLERYGQAIPPIYNISKITAPVALVYSDNDVLAQLPDVYHLISELPNIALKKFIKSYDHLDPIWAHNVGSLKQLIKKYGYPVEVHKIHTEDRYVLETHRIPHGKDDTGHGKTIPVLFVAGSLCSSSEWINMGPKGSLAFMLADEGYDVWLANYRGTRWSKTHEDLDPVLNEKEFFDYSFQEIGYYDIPALTDYIFSTTNHSKIFYVGHSQGTTSVFATMAKRPLYNDNMRLIIALAPIMYINDLSEDFLPLFEIFIKAIQALFEYYGLYELFPYNPKLTLLGQILCNDDSLFQPLCATIFNAINGFSNNLNKALFEYYGLYELFPYNPKLTLLGQILCNDDSLFQPLCATIFNAINGFSNNLNKTTIPVILSNAPAGTSSRSLLHYMQLAKAKKFQHYDFGEAENIVRYGQPTPPEYDIDKITAPVALYYGGKDHMASPANVEYLSSKLVHVIHNKKIDSYGHLDFLWATNSVAELYNDVIKLIKMYSEDV
ncbi:hypothetical protein FQA39_LY13754 [Lamprigera yunnana]|nr:hypothetical protein FQA39_LY13754 [Lamprigera yunnana]